MTHRWVGWYGLGLASLLVLVPVLASADEGSAPTRAAKGARKYVLRYSAKYTCAYPNGGSDTVVASGSIPLTVPPGGGAVSARGSFKHTGTGYAFAGPLVLKGEVRGGVLHFRFPAGFSGGQRVYNRTDALQLKLVRGASVIVPHRPVGGVQCQGDVRFTVETSEERWRITVDDHLIEYGFNEGPSVKARRAGLRLHIRREVEVTVENGRFKEGHGDGRYVSIRSYSHPPWAYQVKAAVTEVRGTGLDIEAERFDQAHWAKRFNPPKTPLDAALKKAWESIKKTRTPAITPARYPVNGALRGRALDLRFPSPFSYTVAVYVKLDVAAVQKRDLEIGPATRREFMNVERGVLAPRLRVVLRDGWRHADAPAKALRRTTIRVKRIE